MVGGTFYSLIDHRRETMQHREELRVVLCIVDTPQQQSLEKLALICDWKRNLHECQTDVTTSIHVE